jgi:hypothetical protein
MVTVTAHRWTHTKPFKCDICPFRFQTKGGLISKCRFFKVGCSFSIVTFERQQTD